MKRCVIIDLLIVVDSVLYSNTRPPAQNAQIHDT